MLTIIHIQKKPLIEFQIFTPVVTRKNVKIEKIFILITGCRDQIPGLFAGKQSRVSEFESVIHFENHLKKYYTAVSYFFIIYSWSIIYSGDNEWPFCANITVNARCDSALVSYRSLQSVLFSRTEIVTVQDVVDNIAIRGEKPRT